MVKDGQTQYSRRAILHKLIFKFRGICVETDKLIRKLYGNANDLE